MRYNLSPTERYLNLLSYLEGKRLYAPSGSTRLSMELRVRSNPTRYDLLPVDMLKSSV
jgi:hypothetical protein